MSSKLRWLAKLGYASRGILYLIVGGLVLLAAFGQGGSTESGKGALGKIFELPLVALPALRPMAFRAGGGGNAGLWCLQ